jgi:hypothetical protein
MSLRRSLAALLLAATLGTTLTAGAAQAQPAYPPGWQPPPPGIAENVPPPPGAAYVWLPGHWQWTGYRYVWVRGHYVVREAYWHHWVDGHWAVVYGRWAWVPGHWN